MANPFPGRWIFYAAALIVVAISAPAYAQSLGSLTLPPGQIVTGPVAYGQSLWNKDCPPGQTVTKCQGQVYPSITNGHDADTYLLPYTWPSTTTPPFVDSPLAAVAVVWTSTPTQYVRFYDATSNPAGSWVVPSNQVRGLTPEQIKDVLALPTTPTMQTIALLPAHTCILLGQAGPITDSQQVQPHGFWGNGGAIQGYLIGQSPSGCGPSSDPLFIDQSNFVNRQSIGLFALAYGPRAGGGNPGTVAFALDHAIFPAQFTDMDGVYNALDLLNYGDSGSLRYALRQLDGEVNANVASIAIGAGRMFAQVLRDQIHLGRVPTVPRLANGWRPWISGFGGAASLYGSQDFEGLRFSGGGAAVGADYLFSPALLVGLSAAYTRSSFGLNGVSGSGNLDSYSIGSYAGYASNDVYIDAALGYSYNQTAVSRSIAFPGLARTATASFNNDSLLSTAEVGYDFHWSDRLTTAPFASFQSIVFFARGFSEQGAGAVNLNVTQRTVATAMSALGAELSYGLPLGLSAPLTLSGRAGWAHDFADVHRKVLQNFQGALRTDFWAEGARWPRNAAAVGAKLTLSIAEADLFIRYDGMFSNNADIFSATGGAAIRF
ncbi:autotransporter outer membrane beta-barrel domain-containing protein [Methylocystis sp. 9N]|uniref:Autotransporter outer membrane beta-barrel domain-containing protein n=1 Tax=Methylocystis borbori TaxID=3118750 RepID=A0ABU7XED5_9HYPH